MRFHADVTLLDDPETDRSWKSCRSSGVLGIIEQFNLALVINALDRASLATRMVEQRCGLTANSFSGIRSDLFDLLLRYLRLHGIVVVRADGTYDLTQSGLDLLSEVSLAQLGFYVEAYGPVVTQIPGLLSGDMTYGVDVERDGRALAEHCATLFGTFHTDTVFEAMGDLNARRVLDLGCGAGQFLIDAAKRNPDFSGVGIDNSPAAIDSAVTAASLAGVDGRIEFIVADAFNPSAWPDKCRNVDALLAVGVLHEHFREGELAVIALLNELATLFGDGVRSLLLGEPEIRYDRENSDSDLLLVHIFTAQGLPRPREEWLRVIAQSKLTCRRIYTRANAGPRFNFFDLTVDN